MIVRIETLHRIEHFRLLPQIQKSAWGFADIDVEPHHLMTRVQKYGGLIQGLFLDEELIGFTYAVIGKWAGEYFLYSHMSAVRCEYQGRGFGFLLKEAQRREVLKMGYPVIRWNFDPLEATNSYFNIHRLGAESSEYERNIYGVGESGLHRGMATDRLIACWRIDSLRVGERLAKKPPALRIDEAVIQVADFSRSPAYIEIPRDIRTLKERDMDSARSWRDRTGRQFEEAFARGYVAREILFSDADDRLFYRMEKP